MRATFASDRPRPAAAVVGRSEVEHRRRAIVGEIDRISRWSRPWAPNGGHPGHRHRGNETGGDDMSATFARNCPNAPPRAGGLAGDRSGNHHRGATTGCGAASEDAGRGASFAGGRRRLGRSEPADREDGIRCGTAEVGADGEPGPRRRPAGAAGLGGHRSAHRRRRGRGEPAGRERGSASVLVLGVGLCLLLIAGALAVVATAVELRHRAQIGADTAALAGAMRAIEGAEAACARARELAAANHTAILACELSGSDVTVKVGAVPPRPLSVFGSITAIARAGPVTVPPGGGHGGARAAVRNRGP